MLVTEPFKEKRRALQPTEVGVYNPGLRRVVERAIEELGAHDLEFSHFDRVHWQTAYSLLNHHEQVRSVMARLGRAWRRNERDVLIGEIAAQLHDIGKLDEACKLYRINRGLTTEEKSIVDTHAPRSGDYINRVKNMIRAEDYPVMEDTRVVVCSHHDPRLVENARLRRISFDLHLADVFVTCQEDRPTGPARGMSQALDEVHKTVDREIGRMEEHLQYELLASMVMITQIYSVDLRKMEDDLKPDA